MAEPNVSGPSAADKAALTALVGETVRRPLNAELSAKILDPAPTPPPRPADHVRVEKVDPKFCNTHNCAP